MAVNSPIQGSAADIIKMVMKEVHLKCHTIWKGCKLMMNIHDEIVLEVNDELIDEVCITLKELMENIVSLKVPLLVTVEIGKHWGSLQSYQFKNKMNEIDENCEINENNENLKMKEEKIENDEKNENDDESMEIEEMP